MVDSVRTDQTKMRGKDWDSHSSPFLLIGPQFSLAIGVGSNMFIDVDPLSPAQGVHGDGSEPLFTIDWSNSDPRKVC